MSIANRKRLLAFYDDVKGALKAGQLTSEGGAVPTSSNELLVLLPGEQTPLKPDRELTDWAVDNDYKYAAFLDAWRAQTVTVSKTSKLRTIAAPLHQATTRLHRLKARGAKRAELKAAVNVFLDVYVLSQHALRLPYIDRAVPAEISEGIEFNEQKVDLGNDAKGTYIGLVQRRESKGDQAPATP